MNPKKPPVDLLSWRAVAKIMKVPYDIILRLKRNFFGENKPKPSITKRITRSAARNLSPYPASLVTMATITDEELNFLTSKTTIREWAPYSLMVRCNLFHRRFPDRRISASTLRKVMIGMGFKMKIIKVINAPQRKSDRLQEFEEKILELDQIVTRVLEQGGHLVFCDECIFTARGFQTHAWAQKYDNVIVEDRTGDQPC